MQIHRTGPQAQCLPKVAQKGIHWGHGSEQTWLQSDTGVPALPIVYSGDGGVYPVLGRGPHAWPHSRSRPGSIPVPLAQRSSVLISVSCPHLPSLFLPSFSLQPTGSFYKADLIVWLPPFLLTWPCLQTAPLPSVSRALPWGIFPLPHPPSPHLQGAKAGPPSIWDCSPPPPPRPPHAGQAGLGALLSWALSPPW